MKSVKNILLKRSKKEKPPKAEKEQKKPKREKQKKQKRGCPIVRAAQSAVRSICTTVKLIRQVEWPSFRTAFLSAFAAFVMTAVLAVACTGLSYFVSYLF